MSRPSRRKLDTDVVIIGGGVIGCGAAWELAKASLRVLVLERSVPGAEASSAAAGILGAQAEAHDESALFELMLHSRELYPSWARELARDTGIDIELRRSGVLRLANDARSLSRMTRELAFQQKRGCAVESWNSTRLASRVPALRAPAGALAFPDDCRVDPRKLLRALRIAGEHAGAEFRSGAYVSRVRVEDGVATGVELGDGSQISAEHVVVAAGSWSSLVAGVPLPSGGVIPARGQIVELTLPSPVLSWVVFGSRCYLVPRDDGRLLVGSTLEFVGYRREVTARAVRDLLDAALELVPALADASLTDSWSSFRPYVADGLPVLGRASVERLCLATGHYRNGVLLAPVTAKIVRALVLGRKPPVDVTAFSPDRSGHAEGAESRASGTVANRRRRSGH